MCRVKVQEGLKSTKNVPLRNLAGVKWYDAAKQTWQECKGTKVLTPDRHKGQEG